MRLNQYYPDYVAIGCIILTSLFLNQPVSMSVLKHYSHYENILPPQECLELIRNTAQTILLGKKGTIYHRFTSYGCDIISQMNLGSIDYQKLYINM